MKFNKKYNYTSHLLTILLLLMLLVVESCNNKNSNSEEEMNGMESMKNDNEAEQDTMQNNMKGMDMGEHNMKNMKVENKAEQDTMPNNMKGMDMGEHNMESMNKSDGTSSSLSDSLKIGSLVMPANYQVISSQKSVKPVKKDGINEINAQGYISIDERRNNKVSSRISGRIEKLYIKYNFQYVKKGEKIMELYSPELNTYQEELVFLMKGGNDSSLTVKAEEKLRLLGVTQRQINDIKRTGNTFSIIDIYNPQGGYVFFKPSSPVSSMSNSTTSKMNSMGNTNNTSNSLVSSDGQIREGNYVNKGDVLFWVNDLELVWAMIAVDNSHQQELKTGAKVLLISELYKNDTISVAINFIEPAYMQNQKFSMSRIYLNNSDKKYIINSLLEAKISSGKSSSLIVPYSSVLFLGKRKIVWVLKGKTEDNNKIFEARDVIIGLMHNGMIEIKKGLSINDEIANDAGYLLDRESLIKPE